MHSKGASTAFAPVSVEMVPRRDFVNALSVAAIVLPIRGDDALPRARALDDVRDGEDLFSYLRRTRGRVERSDVLRVLGAANPFKEGDASIGVAAADEAERASARALLTATTLGQLDGFPLLDDSLSALLRASEDSAASRETHSWTFGALRSALLSQSAGAIERFARGLTSEVIGSVVKLMSNDELIAVGAKLGHALPGSSVGAPGYLGARLQPNSPTDNPEDIRWQVFDGWSYGVGDVLLGTNPVSSEPESVLAIERTLQDVIRTFGLEDVLPHCVLAHVDIQAEVERAAPGSTALWFQSLAGTDGANRTFDITVEKMLAHAAARDGRYGLYFETGQGADVTNAQAQGVDMVILESRKYGFARALSARVAAAQRAAGRTAAPWVIVNDVAGFIGPEVFRTRDQLLRCVLEDTVMGKLHGLTHGLDVCATLHMDVGIEDLDWCLDRAVVAGPAYLMALPTKVDPMLGYLTTGFHDHVRLRARSGSRVNPPMQAFFESLGVLDANGGPGPHFGDPLHVYVAYMRRRGDARPEAALRADGARAIAEVRSRGVFLAEGQGGRAENLPPSLDRAIHQLAADAKQAFWAALSPECIAGIRGAVTLETDSVSREDYILHPTTGERLSARSMESVRLLRQRQGGAYDAQIVVSDGLNPLAMEGSGAREAFLEPLRAALAAEGWRVAPETLVVRSGRVRAAYQIGSLLHGGKDGHRAIIHVVGERPGTGHHTFSVYLTAVSGERWAAGVDHDVTKVVSGIGPTALAPELGVLQVARVLGVPR
jgi:ethanolamine ammonia-lyase large subunit